MSFTVTTLSPDDQLAFAAARLLAVETAPYLAAALFSVTPLAAPGLGTFAVDRHWRLYMDPECFGRWTPSQCGAVLTHEIGHLIRQHAERAEAAMVDDHRAWNYAADAEINDDLLDAGSDLPPNCVTPQSLGCEPGDFAEAYYAAIPPRDPSPGSGVNDAACGSGAGGPQRPWELGGGITGDPDSDGLDPVAADLVRRRVALDIAGAPGKGRGSAPGGWERWAARELAPPTVSWRRLLGGAVRHALAWNNGGEHATYQRPGRRQIPGIVTPAMRRPQRNLVVVVDTSGSMSMGDLDAAMAEVEGIAKQAGVRGRNLRLIAVDAVDHSVTQVTHVNKVVLTGGGGTDMRVGITMAEGLKPRPNAIVVLTDGDTPWPEQPTRSRLVCGIISTGEPHGTPLWATTVHIPPR
jgi:predicted metal-dependent peptidase